MATTSNRSERRSDGRPDGVQDDAGYFSGSDEIIEQITKQLNKLIDVVKLQDITGDAHVEREVMLVKVRVAGSAREDVKRIADIFRGRILDVTQSTYIIEVTGDGAKLDAFINALDRSSIIEVVRSGSLAIGRGEKGLRL